MKRRYLAVSSLVVVVILVLVLSVLGVFVVLSLSDDPDHQHGAATPEEAVTGWAAAYNRNDWAGSMDNSIMHFASAEVKDAHASDLGDLATSVQYENLTVVPGDTITEKKRTYIEKEMNELWPQLGSPNLTDYSLIRYDRTMTAQGVQLSNGTEYCVVVQVGDRWYKTFILFDEYFWSNTMWEEDWYVPTFLYSASVVMNDSDVWNIVMVDCPANTTIEGLDLQFSFFVDNFHYYCDHWFISGNPGNVSAIHETMTQEQVENADHYQVGFVDIEGDGLLSLGDYFYIVMDEVTGDNAKLAPGTIVTYQVSMVSEANSSSMIIDKFRV